MPDTKHALAGATGFAAATNYDTATALATGDTLHHYDGAADITVGVSQPSIDLASWTIAPGFGGRLGGKGNPIVVDCSAGTIRYEGAGEEFWLSAGSGGTFAKVQFMPASGCRLYLGSGAVTVFESDGGGSSFWGAGAVLGSGYFAGGYHVLELASAATLIEVGAGAVVHCKRDFAAARVAEGGRLILDADGVTLGDVDLDGGVLEHRAGSLGALVARAGIYDHSMLRKSATVSSYTHGRGVLRRLTNGPIQPTFSSQTVRGRGERRAYVG